MSGPQNESPSLRSLITAQAGVALLTDDVLLLVLPLFQQVAELHAHGKVAALDPDSILIGGEGGLCLRYPEGEAPLMDIDAVRRVQPHAASGLNIIGTLQSTHDEHGTQVSDAAFQSDVNASITRPVFLPGPASWEKLLGHHDEITDIFLLGCVLGSLACGLDFADEDDLRSFVGHRNNLFVLNDRLHPIVATVVVEMTEINRHDRATDVATVATRLRTWRDQPLGLDVERVMAGASGATPRRTAVLSHLRDRLFDLSRRNRLLYYRQSAASVNLTVASVPLMLQVDRIRADQICTWGGPFAADIVAGKAVALQSWLRFEDQPYLPGSLDHLISETRRDRAEFGFSNLRLVIAFLRWHNLKEAPDERILSPLLWMPVELSKRKGVRDQYLIQCAGSEAEFNPVLRHHLRQLYDIKLPESIDLEKTTLAEVHADILAQIRRSEPAVELRLIDKAAIRLVRQKALQRLQQYQRRKPSAKLRASTTGWLPPYSYAREDYRPLGRSLFEHWVRPTALPQRFEAGARPDNRLRQPNMSELAEESVERTGYVLQESEGHRYAWDLDLTQVTLANFNYKKMSLVRDYAQLLDKPETNQSFDRVFSIEPRSLETSAIPAPPAGELWSVVASDATQNAAVGLARTERSFIIQGPPGTGKSQTITNLIADYAGRGKRVLFVCEKRAALDVVFHRLKQSGIDSLCSLIHDSQTDKKAFIADMKTCYEGWTALPHDGDALQADRRALVDRLNIHQSRIDAFEEAMAVTRDALGASVRSLLRRLVDLPTVIEVGQACREHLPGLAAWDSQRELSQRLHRSMRERFGLQSLAAHPFSRLSRALTADERAFNRAERLCQEMEILFDTLDPVLLDSNSPISEGSTLASACAMAADSAALLATGLAAHLDLLDKHSSAAAGLVGIRDELQDSKEALAQVQVTTQNWRDKLSPDDTASALTITRACEASIARWLQPTWWRVRSEIRRRYDFSRHAVHPGYTKVLENLSAEHAAAAALAATENAGRKKYGVPDFFAFMQALDDLVQRLDSGGPRALIEHLNRAADPTASARIAAGAREALGGLARHAAEALELDTKISLGDLAELTRDLREALDDLPDLLPSLRAVHAADPAYAWLIQHIDQPPHAMEALILDEALRRLERANPVLAKFGGAGLAQSARAVAQVQRDLLGLNAQVVRSVWHRRFSENVRISQQSATQLDTKGKELKKRYATGRRELEHEFSKSMRHRSIRDLCGDETGAVINDIKPIWLMSPLSVSDTLPLFSDLFDVAIFDEASQIPTEEAVPALSRARQVIVVGDEMQLPPTSFFSTAAEDGDNEIFIEEDGERIAINLDSDSLLNQAARNLPATLLAWHYRSRHEALISFSNAAFYDGRLVTIPDRALEQEQDEPPACRSDAEEAGAQGADMLLATPISFHRISDGVYIDRCNLPEAHYIAQMTRELLLRETGLSLGIVAFSEAQQSAIENELETLAGQDQDFATRLEREYLREDDDQFNGLFVKNLENVQGDERDAIILSICYAPGPDGKMLMNFGPINQRGGEKRLNVIFSRARHRMAVVSTIQSEAITNVHNDGAAALRAFLQFAHASAIGQFERAQGILGALNQGARNAFARLTSSDSIRDALAAALRARGHQVHIDVGRSRFRCDLAIVAPSGSGYTLAILLDGPGEIITDTAERYVFRPGILRSFGWRVLDIPGHDWVENPDAVIARIEATLHNGEDRALDVELDIDAIVVPPAAVTQTFAEPATESDSKTETAGIVRTLRFEQGGYANFGEPV
ncbi:MAG: AAA domain-containing protein [Rhodocyclaceae bacterium]